MITIKKAVFSSALLLMSSWGAAQPPVSINVLSEDACHQKDSTIEIQKCDTQRYQDADKQLNAIYSAAIKKLDQNKKLTLQESQRAWIKYRDTTFSLVLSLNNDVGTYGGVVYGNFKANFVSDRVKELVNIFVEPSGDMPEWWPSTAPTWRDLRN